MKVRIFYYVCDGGDGSYSPAFFATEEQMNAYMISEEENMGYTTDGYGSAVLEFDDNGVLLNPDEVPA